MHSSQIELPVEYSFGRAHQMAFQMRDAHMDCEGIMAFRHLCLFLANDIALKGRFFFSLLKVMCTYKETYICLKYTGSVRTSDSVW